MVFYHIFLKAEYNEMLENVSVCIAIHTLTKTSTILLFNDLKLINVNLIKYNQMPTSLSRR